MIVWEEVLQTDFCNDRIYARRRLRDARNFQIDNKHALV